MTPLEDFKAMLPIMPLERIEKIRESLKGSVGGGTKTPTEAMVAADFHAAINAEIARRRDGRSS